MMYKWNVKFILKSGVSVEGVYKGKEDNSGDVASKFLVCADNTFNGLHSENNGNLLVNCSDVSAIDITPILKKDQYVKYDEDK